jgi:carbon starvation protein CstA
MNMENEDKLKEFMLKEIEIIQDIIRRMGFNSFMIKGWAITLVVVTLLLRGTEYQVWIAFIPLLVFWFLDAYFLWQEWMHRKLYEWVTNNRLKTEEYLFDMNAYRFEGEVQPRFRIMFSITLGWFYVSIAILIVIYSILLFLVSKGGS